MASKVALNAPVCNVVSIIFLFFTVSGASTTHYVGGEIYGWKMAKWKHIPDHRLPLNRWARRTRFQVWDFLEWNINPSVDSVLRVTKKDYKHCNTERPIARFLGGKVRFLLNRKGPFFFISGNRKRCKSGEKLHVMVLTPRPELTAPETVALPARPALTSKPRCTPPSTTGPLISSGSSSLAPTSTTMQIGILLFILAALSLYVYDMQVL